MEVKEEERFAAVNRHIRRDKPSNICRDADMLEKWLFTWVKRYFTELKISILLY